jgi:hypothetical protein
MVHVCNFALLISRCKELLNCFIPRVKQDVGQELHPCFPCFKLKAAASQQLMCQLPFARITVALPF